jgi:hypothetical protein
MDKDLYSIIIKTLVDQKLIEYFNIEGEATEVSKEILIKLSRYWRTDRVFSAAELTKQAFSRRNQIC